MVNLNELVEKTFGQYQAEQNEAKAQQRAAEEAKKRAVVDEFTNLLKAEIGDEMFDALGIEVAVYDQIYVRGKWSDKVSATQWEISVRWVNQNTRVPSAWSITATNRLHSRVFSHEASVGNTTDAILIGLGTAREEEAKRLRIQAQQDEKKRQEQEVANAEYRQRQQNLDELKRVDDEIRDLIRMAREEAISLAWSWPKGVEVTIYVMEYCAGAANMGEDGYQFDYRHLYTETDQLDAQGYITAYVPDTYGAEQVEHLRLSPTVHKPTWSRLVLAKIEDIPQRLMRHDITCVVEGIAMLRNFDEPAMYYYASNSTEEFIAQHNGLPAKWLRDLVDRAATV